jgi:hypothetical protein
LRNLPENRCPECGRVFDPYDPHTYGVELNPNTPKWMLTYLWICLFGGLFLLGLLVILALRNF